MAFPVRISNKNRADVGLDMGPWEIGGALYAFCLNGTPTKAGVAKSTDSGLTWTFQDSANAPDVSAGSARYSVVQFGTTIRIVYGDAGGVGRVSWNVGYLHVKDFDTTTDTFGAVSDSTIEWSPGGIADPAPSIVARRDSSTGTTYIVFVNRPGFAALSPSQLRYVSWAAGVFGTPADVTALPGVDNGLRVQPGTALIAGGVIKLPYWQLSGATNSLLFANVDTAGSVTAGQTIESPVTQVGVAGNIIISGTKLLFLLTSGSTAFSNLDTLRMFIGDSSSSATPTWSSTSPDSNTYPATFAYEPFGFSLQVAGTQTYIGWSVFDFFTPMSQVYVNVSLDDGATWNTPTLVYDAVANPPGWTSAGIIDEISFGVVGTDILFTGNINSAGTATLGELGAPLALSCNNPPDGTVGVLYSHFLIATGGLPPYAFSIIGGSLPNGLTLDASTGEISGTPTLAGTFPFGARVTDDDGNTANVECSITIAANPLEIDCNNPPAGEVGTAYSHTFSATGGVPPYTYSITAGALPDGLTLDPNTGEVTGTPTVAGLFSFTVTVTDSSGATTSATAYAIGALATTAQNANWVQANKGPWYYNSNRYTLARNGSDLQFYESTDDGQTWAAYGPTQTIGDGIGFFRNYDAVEALDGSNVWLCWIDAGALTLHGELIVQSFDLATATWGAVSTGGPQAYASNGADDDTAGSAMLTRIGADDFGLIYRPAPETIAGSTHWTSSTYVGGSAFKLSAAVGAADLTISVFLSESSLTAPGVGNYFEVDAETMLIGSVTPTATGYDLGVTRGQAGTNAATHAQYALCTEAAAGALLDLPVTAGGLIWRLNGVSYTPVAGHTIVCESETALITAVTPLGGNLYDCTVTRGTFLTTAAAHSEGRIVSRVTTTASNQWDRTVYVRYTSGVWGTPVAIGGDTNELQDYTPHGVVTGDGVDVAFMVSVVKAFPYPGSTYTLNLYARTVDHASNTAGALVLISDDLAWGPNIEESASMPFTRSVSGVTEVSLGYIRPYAGYPQSDANNLQPMEAKAAAVEPLAFTTAAITTDEAVSVSGNPVKSVSIKGDSTTKYAVWAGQNPDPPYTLYYARWTDTGGVWGTPVALYTVAGTLQTPTAMLVGSVALGMVFSQYPDVGTDELMYYELGFGETASVECSIRITATVTPTGGGAGGGGGYGKGGGSTEPSGGIPGPRVCTYYLKQEQALFRAIMGPRPCCHVPGEMPFLGQRFQKRASIALPAVGTATAVLTVDVPVGYDGWVTQIVHRFIGTGWLDAEGYLTWSIKQGRRYIADYGTIINQIGSLSKPYKIGGAGIPLVSGQRLQYLVTLSAAGSAALQADGMVQCALNGWWAPRRAEADRIERADLVAKYKAVQHVQPGIVRVSKAER